jgi:hypothetical protein
MTETVNNAVVVGSGVDVIKKIEINMESLVSLGIAKAERKLKLQQRSLSEKAADLKKDIEKFNKKIQDICDKSVPKTIEKLKTDMSAVFKATKFSSKTSLDITCLVVLDKRENVYQAFITVNESSMVEGCLKIAHVTVPFTREQRSLLERIEDARLEINQVNTDIVKIRSKLADFPTLERQIRAHVVEHELSKTTEGMQVINTALADLEKNLDSFIGI